MTSEGLEPAIVSQAIRNLAISNAISLLLLCLVVFATFTIRTSSGRDNAGSQSYSTSLVSSDIQR
jgi:hypothetical protein